MSISAIISAIAITAPTSTSAPKSSSKSTATKSEPGTAVGVNAQGQSVDADGNVVETSSELGKEKLKTETPLQKPKSATEEKADVSKQTIKGLEIVGQIKTAEQANKQWEKDANAKPATETSSGNPIKDKVTSLQNDIANLTNSSGQSRIQEATSDQKTLIDTLKTDPGQYGFEAPKADANSQQSTSTSGGSTAGGPLSNALSGGAGGLGGNGSTAINSGNNIIGNTIIANSGNSGAGSFGGLSDATNTNFGNLSRENVIGGEGRTSITPEPSFTSPINSNIDDEFNTATESPSARDIATQ